MVNRNGKRRKITNKKKWGFGCEVESRVKKKWVLFNFDELTDWHWKKT